jgi:uncharacterized protein (UPF0333 family)
MNYFAFLVLAVVLAVSNAFVVSPSTFGVAAVSTSSSALEMTILTYGGKKKDFKAGSPLKNACSALGVKPKYSCKK